MALRRADCWAVVLAGGDGTRLRELTRFLAGDERPKQFCSIFGGQTLVEQTLRGVSQVVPVSRTVIVLTRAHERFYGPLTAGQCSANDGGRARISVGDIRCLG